MTAQRKPPTLGGAWAVHKAFSDQLAIEAKLADAILAQTGVSTSIVADGEIHRHDHPDGKRGNKRIWYVCHHDFAVWGDWGTGEQHNVFAKGPIDPETATKARMEAERRKHERKARDERRRAQAAESARQATHRLPWADSGHPYLVKKKIKPIGLKQQGSKLVAAMTDGRRIVNYQTIDPDGRKRFLAGAKKQGAYFAIGHIGDRLVVCEGVATAISIHLAYGCAVAAAMDCGNLKPVALNLRNRYPDVPIVIMADNDIHRPNNPGVTHGKAAAEAVGGQCVWPAPSPVQPDAAIDFNDLWQGGLLL
ncbi:toprim domain-containing protein [Halomonas sp. H5]|uniref:toprim domain-containing protein n=1 Tax=Halomonas sp. H5 TaxID=3423910 RepID=UPI003D36BDB2